MKSIDILLILLEAHRANKEMQAICLQSYIANYGPVPDEYGEQVKQLLK